jgi:hypothetical protein
VNSAHEVKVMTAYFFLILGVFKLTIFFYFYPYPMLYLSHVTQSQDELLAESSAEDKKEASKRFYNKEIL